MRSEHTISSGAGLQVHMTNKTMSCFKAIAIVLVVAGHVSSTGLNGPFDLIRPYSFHVAAFAFASGYFFSLEAWDRFLPWLFKKVRRLIVPMYGMYLTYGLLMMLLHRIGFTFGADLTPESLILGRWLDGPQFSLNMPMWFVAPFFVAQVAYALIYLTMKSLIEHVIQQFARNNRGEVVSTLVDYISVAVCTLLGGAAIHWGGSDGFGPGMELLVCRTLFFLPWLSIGKIYRSELELRDTLTDSTYLTICLVAELLIVTMCRGSNVYTPGWCQFPHGVVLTYASTVVGIAFLLRVSRIVSRVMKDGGPVCRLGETSWSIMCHHVFGFFLVKLVFAAVSAVTPLFSGFDLAAFLTQSGYVFFPRNLPQWALLYVAAGMVISIVLHSFWERTKGVALGACARAKALFHSKACV